MFPHILQPLKFTSTINQNTFHFMPYFSIQGFIFLQHIITYNTLILAPSPALLHTRTVYLRKARRLQIAKEFVAIIAGFEQHTSA
jgi:hypothetical protein